MQQTTIRVGARGTVIIPASIHQNYRFEEGTFIIAETLPEGVLLRPVAALPVELYSKERKAEFILNNAVTPEDYASAVKEVRKMDLSPEQNTSLKRQGAISTAASI